MQISKIITFGEITSSIIAFIALVVAGCVAIFQIKLNKRLLLVDNLVAVNAEISSNLITGTNDDNPYWELQIYNIGKSIIYLTEYIFDGKRNSNINRILPPVFGQGYFINLPKIEGGPAEDIPQHHIELIINDVEDKKYSCSIYVKFINGRWREEVTRCKKI